MTDNLPAIRAVKIMSSYSTYAYLYNAYAFSRWFGHKRCNKKVPDRELGLKLHVGQVSKAFITTLAEHGKKRVVEALWYIR